MCSEHLECFQISSSTMSLRSWNPNFSQDRPIFGRRKKLFTPMGLNESLFSISFRKSCQNLSSPLNTKKNINILVKKGFGPTFTWQNVPWFFFFLSTQRGRPPSRPKLLNVKSFTSAGIKEIKIYAKKCISFVKI